MEAILFLWRRSHRILTHNFDIRRIHLRRIGIAPSIRGLCILFLLSLLILVTMYALIPMNAPAHQSALIYYVSPDGDDDQEGSLDHPWATINHASATVGPGDTVYIKGGVYSLTAQIRPQQSGTRENPITYAAVPGEHAILDAQHIRVLPPSGEPPFAHDQGAFHLEDLSYIRVRDLEIINSHNAGFTVRNSHYVQLYNNTVNNTFSSGIGVWQGDHHQVMGNTVINANLPRLADYERQTAKATPHEAITLGGVEYFEVAYNSVHNGEKEGIDIKETSRHGIVHHNHVHHVERQGLYVDSWFGVLNDVELYDNVVHHCKGGGFMVSAEGGPQASNIRFHHNLIYDNWGTGILLSRWGQDRLRKDIKIYNNTLYHNGFGPPNPGEDFHWITGGLYLFSTHLEDVAIHHNIFAENTGFQVGYSDRYLASQQVQNQPSDNSFNGSTQIESIFAQKNIQIHDNLMLGDNDTQSPIYVGWPPDNFAYVYGIYGTDEDGSIAEHTITDPNQPLFLDAYRDNFYPNPDQLPGSLDVNSTVGMFPVNQPFTGQLDQEATIPPSAANLTHHPPNTDAKFWWKANFPPHLDFELNTFSNQ